MSSPFREPARREEAPSDQLTDADLREVKLFKESATPRRDLIAAVVLIGFEVAWWAFLPQLGPNDLVVGARRSTNGAQFCWILGSVFLPLLPLYVFGARKRR